MQNVLGTNIRTRRAQCGLTQAELGEAVGVGAQTISRIEDGANTTTDRVAAIAERLGCTPADLHNPDWFPPARQGAQT